MKYSLLFTCLLMSASFRTVEAIEKKNESKNPCQSIDLKKFTLNPPVFSSFTESEKEGYEGVRELVKEVFEERKLKLINEKMADIEVFCPAYKNFNKLKREEFFSHLLANIARYESHYSPKDAMTETSGVVSRGLLAISYESQTLKGYQEKGCNIIKHDLDLADGKSNIQCGMAIFSHWIVNDGYLALNKTKGASRYWSTLRDPYLTCLNSNKKDSAGKILKDKNGNTIKVARVVTVGFKKVIIEGLKEKMPSCFKK